MRVCDLQSDSDLTVLAILAMFFLTDWEALCTALRMDNIRHRSKETMSNIT